MAIAVTKGPRQVAAYESSNELPHSKLSQQRQQIFGLYTAIIPA
jgi:hypothetical protein